MKLILTSEFHRVANKLLDHGILDSSKKRVAFIQNATDKRREQGETIIKRVEDGKDWYINHGFELDIIDLRNHTTDSTYDCLLKYDYIHVHGGDNDHLRNVFISSGIYECIEDLLQKGLVYIGSSAGSLIAGPDITYSVVMSINVSTNRINDIESNNMPGLGLHPFYLVPHAGRSDRLEMMTNRLRYCQKHKLSPYLTYSDEQAIIIEDGKFLFIQ